MENPHPDTPNAALLKNGAFSIAAVQADEDTAGMESEFEQANIALLTALRQREDLELQLEKAEGKLAQADHGRKGVDKAIKDFELALLALVNKSRKDTRYQRYMAGGLQQITEAHMRNAQPAEVKQLLKKMGEDQAAAETDAELKDLLAAHIPRIQAGQNKVDTALQVLGGLEDAEDDLRDITLPGLRQAWISKRQVLYAALLTKFPNDVARVEAYFKPFSKPRKTPKKGSGTPPEGGQNP